VHLTRCNFILVCSLLFLSSAYAPHTSHTRLTLLLLRAHLFSGRCSSEFSIARGFRYLLRECGARVTFSITRYVAFTSLVCSTCVLLTLQGLFANSVACDDFSCSLPKQVAGLGRRLRGMSPSSRLRYLCVFCAYWPGLAAKSSW
jgi:hypothetical protein